MSCITNIVEELLIFQTDSDRSPVNYGILSTYEELVVQPNIDFYTCIVNLYSKLYLKLNAIR